MADSRQRSRYPWLAVLLSFLVPGLGQVYATRACRGLLFFVIYSLWNSMFYLSGIHAMRHGFAQPWFTGLLLALLISLGLSLAIMIDAFLQARRNRHTEPYSYNRPWLYLVAIFIVLGIQSSVSSTLEQVALKAFRIPTASMEPTILAGDYLLADKLFYCRHNPERRDVIIFEKPGKDVTFIKRVIGLPGDSVRIGKDILVNGSLLSELSFRLDNTQKLETSDHPDSIHIVPENHYFVLGDQIENSLDSRHFGSVPRENIIGKAAVIYFSWSTEPSWWNMPARLSSIRWHRIGRVIK